MTEPTPAQLSELIGSIYDRAIDPEGWSETLSRLRIALDSEIAALGLTDIRTRTFLLNVNDNIPEEWLARIARNTGEMIDVWGGEAIWSSHPLEEPIRSTGAKMTGKNGYLEEAVARGFSGGIGMLVARDEHVVGSCLFGRLGPERYGEAEAALIRLLVPHAQRAIAFSRMFELADLRANAFEAALEAAAVPTIMVSARSELIHANSAGHAALDQGDSLRLVNGRVAAADAARQNGFVQALGIAGKRPDAHPRQLTVELDSGSRQLKLLPLPRHTVRGALAPSATAAIVLTGTHQAPRRSDAETAELLIDRHGLTRAEAAVAVEVAKGDGRAAAAARLGIRDNTVRTHLSAVFLKLGLNRQAQLARLIDQEAGGAASFAKNR